MTHRLNVILIAPNCDGTDVGEAFCAHRWVQHMSERANVTLLTQTRPGRTPASAQLPQTAVVEWPEPQLPRQFERVRGMLKPGYPLFAAKCRRWIGEQLKAGKHFDIIHQLTPLALRYASPAYGLGIPYVLGPQAGSLPTPNGFVQECRSAPLFTRLREIDRFRLSADPWLRRSFAGAACILGVAPYVREVLGSIPVQRFEVMTELGVDEPLPPAARAAGGPRTPPAPCGEERAYQGPARLRTRSCPPPRHAGCDPDPGGRRARSLRSARPKPRGSVSRTA